MQKSAAINQPLEESLTNIDIEIAQSEEFGLIRLKVLSLPEASEESIQSLLVSGSRADDLSNAKLRGLASKYKPPQSWYEEDMEGLF